MLTRQEAKGFMTSPAWSKQCQIDVEGCSEHLTWTVMVLLQPGGDKQGAAELGGLPSAIVLTAIDTLV